MAPTSIARYLADTSALRRLRDPVVDARLSPLIETGLVATCAMVELDLRRMTRSKAEYDAVTATRDVGYACLPTDNEDWRRALEVQQELVRRGRIAAVTTADLLVAATAERHDVTVLHDNSPAFKEIAAITGQSHQDIGRRRR